MGHELFRPELIDASRVLIMNSGPLASCTTTMKSIQHLVWHLLNHTGRLQLSVSSSRCADANVSTQMINSLNGGH